MDTDTAMTIVEAIAELNRRAERIRELESHLADAQLEITVGLERIRELEDALKFYASTDSYLVPQVYRECGCLDGERGWMKMPVVADDGETARKALEES